MVNRGRVLRICMASLVVLSSVLLGFAIISASSQASTAGSGSGDEFDNRFERQASLDRADRTQVALERNGTTVIASYDGGLLAIGPEGYVTYLNNTRKSYWDVDPVPNTTHTVMYSATDQLNKSECPADSLCKLNVVEQANLSTGEVQILYERYRPGWGKNEWHDVDRIDENEYVIADMAKDRVFIVNVTTGIIEWSWDPQSAYSIASGESGQQQGVGGGQTGYPQDWTHMNDVEVLEDGRIMVSLRNQDSVVFLDRDTGAVEDWTLGTDDNHSILYEQHNPDYIPRENGGPSVITADSQNNRIVEHHRNEDGDWVEVWNYSDNRMNWPRDSDRLPNGNTLIGDTLSSRVIEVGPDKNIRWALDLPRRGWASYDVERLNTGDESRNGPSATTFDSEQVEFSGPVRPDTASSQDGTSQTEKTDVATSGIEIPKPNAPLFGLLKSVAPTKIVNAVLFVIPGGLPPRAIVPLLMLGVFVPSWIISEVVHRFRISKIQSPVRIQRR